MFSYTDFCQELLKNLRSQDSASSCKIISITGSVAVGKSFFAEKLCLEFNVKQPNSCQVLALDNFLYPNEWIQKNLAMQYKGFPESYQWSLLAEKLKKIIACQTVEIPIYDPIQYNIIPNEFQIFTPTPILIIEGLHLISRNKKIDGVTKKFPTSCKDVWSYIDVSIFIDAEEKLLAHWYAERFEDRFLKGKENINSYFYQFNSLSKNERDKHAKKLWNTINLKNFKEWVLSLKDLTDYRINKKEDHIYKIE
ncbi:MAG: hypothetical protein V4629_08660 [Pseudomonadota bacterium]